MKKVNLACIFMLWQFIAFAQTDTTSLLGAIQSTFSALNPSNIPTGLLINRTLPMGNVSYYTGNGDSSCTIANYRQIILDLHNAAKQNTAIIPSLDAIDQKASAYLDEGIFPIGVSFVKYDYIKAEAVDSGWMAYDTISQKLHDIQKPAVWPYNNTKVFVGAVFNPVTWKGICKFKLPTNLYISNINLNISNVQANFGDGNGYVNWGFDEAKTINYTNLNVEEGTKIAILVKVTYSNNETYIAKTEFVLAKKGDDITPDATIEVKQNFRTTYNTCNITNGFAAADARIYIQYANRLSGQITKPVIFVEGFDVDNNPNDNRYGDIGWETFKTGKCYDEDGKQKAFQLQNLPVFLDRMKQEGYDVIVVDFKNGGTRIESNALTLTSIIQWANSTKVGTNEIAVMGASMGGLIVRYALKLMEQKNCKHCTRLYCTFDSPHQGANISLGVQYFNRFFSQTSQAAKDIYEKKLSSEAAMQMLVYHANPSSSNFRPQWQSTIATMGHPEKTYKVALINGSNNGSGLGFSAGNQIIQYNPTIGNPFIEILANAWSVPNSPNQASNQLVFTGKSPKGGGWAALVNLSPVFWFFSSFSHYIETYALGFPTLPYDNAPGGKTETYKDVREASGYPLGKPAIPSGEDHCFIPSTSALDINTNDLFMDIVSTYNKNKFITPFESIYLHSSNTSNNEKHVEVTTGTNGNIEWIINELKQNEPIAGITTLPNSNGNTFNYAIANKKIVKGSITLNNNGQLRFYGNFKANYGSTNDPFVASGSTNSYYTSECDLSYITINKGGKLIIGDNNGANNNKALLYLTTGSTLHIKNGGQLKIFEGSSLVIQSGAKLIYENGAIIDLNSTNSLVTVQAGGQILLGSNATFNYTGNGYLKFETAANNNVSYVKAVSPNTFTRFMLNGGAFGNKTKKLIYVTGGYTANIDNSLYLFALLNGNVVLDNNSSINVLTNSQMQYIDIFASIPNNIFKRHSGIVFNGYNETLNNVSVYDAYWGITANNFYGGGDITISNFKAERCGTALLIKGKGATIYSPIISNCQHGTGIRFESMDRNTYLYNPTISGCNVGIYGLETYVHDIFLDQPNIFNNIYGVVAEATLFTARCGRIYNNSSTTPNNRGAFEGANIWLKSGGDIIMDPNLAPSTGNMEMRNTRAISIYLDNSLYGPQIESGRNNLWTPLDFSIYGFLPDVKGIASYPDKISTLNIWNFTYQSGGWTSVSPVDLVDYDVKYNYVNLNGQKVQKKLKYLDNVPLSTFQSCYAGGGTSGGGAGPLPGLEFPRLSGNIESVVSPIRNISHSQNTPSGAVIHQQILNGYNYYFAEIPNYYESINALVDALNTSFADTKDMENWSNAILIFNAQLIEALSMGLQNGTIEMYDASKINYSQTVLNVLQVQDKLLNDFTENDAARFNINICKAFIYRMLSNRLMSLDLLIKYTNQVPSYLLNIHNRAICMINSEKNYIEGLITLDSLKNSSCYEGINIDSAWVPYIEETLPNDGKIITSDNTDDVNSMQSQIKLFPNPSHSSTTLQFISVVGLEYEINIIDLIGRKVQTITGISEKENNIVIDTSNLTAGSYILKFISGKSIRTKNLMIAR